jgi:membrane associated rhomboid family serine protease
MLPLRDTITSRNYPVVNHALIAINSIVFLIMAGQGGAVERLVFTYGLVPARYSMPEMAAYFSTGQQAFAFLSFMFLHGGFWHLLGNMWTLYIFGDNVEDHLGPVRYLLFYILCGLASGLSHMLLNLQSPVPTIGASGAIAGVMGAYMILHPHAKILTLIPIIIIPYFVEIPAFFFLGLWLLLQFLSAAGSQGAGGIAWWAHIGGFIFGFLFLRLFQKLPGTGISAPLRKVTEKKTSHRLRVIRPETSRTDNHLRGRLAITPFEALTGAAKVVNVPWGSNKRMLKVIVPAGIKNGQTLRLKGMGRPAADGTRGDLLIKVDVAPWDIGQRES